MIMKPKTLRHTRSIVAVIAIVTCALSLSNERAVASETELWEALKSGGHVALLRHAIAPGTGDPPEFTIGDCETQRNLSDQGREQAERIGRRFKANGIENARIFSSQWCRCLETAELLKLGRISELPVLNSFYQRWDRREPQTEALKKWLLSQDLSRPYVLVTHQVNISALTGVTPTSGELVIIRPSGMEKISVIGRIETE